MPEILPLTPSVPSYRVGTTLNNVSYVLDLRWNARLGIWYMDLLRADETPLRSGMALVLGAKIGLRSADPEFPGVFICTDTTGEDREATLDDLGTRVVVAFYPYDELASLAT